MQIAIWALWKINPLPKCWQAALLKSNEIFVILPDTIKAFLRVNNLQQINVINNSDSPLSFFLFNKDMPDSKKVE